jgi:hypothetical protein
MTSEASLLVACALLAGCNGSVHDLSVTSAPLVVLHAHVERSTLVRSHPDAALLGALIWAGVPPINPLCLKFPVPEIQPACPDPYGVFLAETERVAPLDPDGNFTVELSHLPRAEVSVGDEVTRIAYGSLVVVEDVNGDGRPTLFAPRVRPDGSRVPGIEPDTIVAASFSSLHAAQQRVVFREAGFVASSTFYPATGCAAPPPGFSVQTAPPLADTPAAAEACTFRSADSTVELDPLAREPALALLCRAVGRDPRVHEARSEDPRGLSYTPVCLARDFLALVSAESCGDLIAFSLRGCDEDPFCLNPQWDHTMSPPLWWPCH